MLLSEQSSQKTYRQLNFQEMILEKVQADATARRKIGQSSTWRLKQGPHDLHAPPKCEAVDPPPPAPGPVVNNNNNLGPCSLKPAELELCLLPAKPGGKEEWPEDVASPDSLSEVSRFESE